MLKNALGSIANTNRFFIYRLEWDAEQGKYLKWPTDRKNGGSASPMGNPEKGLAPVAVMSFDEATRTLAEWGPGHALGWWFEPGCGYWFLDIDNALVNGQLTHLANELYQMLAPSGVFFEWSSSRSGMHLIGRDLLLDHGTKPKGMGLELYSGGRGVCFGLTGEAWGNADASGSVAIHEIARKYFPAVARGAAGEFEKPRSDWAGPADDDELIALACKSIGALAKFGQSESFPSLWVGDGEKTSERDASLAQHLAYWTGCDAPRIERLMRKSGLYREKWDGHKTYLRELTIAKACSRQKEVLHRKGVEGLYVPAPLVLPDVAAPVLVLDTQAQEQAIDLIATCTSDADMHQRIIPGIKALRVSGALMPRVVHEVCAMLKILRADLPKSAIRALLNSDAVVADGTATVEVMERPGWLDDWVYLINRHAMYHKDSDAAYGPAQFHAQMAREPAVPVNQRSGDKENVFKLATEQWHCNMAHDSHYHAGESAYFEFDGKTWLNEFNPGMMPLAAREYTEAGMRGIKAFHAHLLRLCGGREDIMGYLLGWLAHQVQHPGVKIKWAPLLVGFEGSGKGIIGRVLTATMGMRNVDNVGPSVINAQGGFTDWAKGKAVTILDEIHMAGENRFQTINLIKEFITEPVVSINRKGTTKVRIPNCTNYIAFTNKHDAAPVSDTDRRWFIIFTPFSTIESLLASVGMASDEEYFRDIWHTLDHCPGEFRKWLMELPCHKLPERAPYTEEKKIMSANSVDDVEHDMKMFIATGGLGVKEHIFSSSCLEALMVSNNRKLPEGRARSHAYLRMGYVTRGAVWWHGKTHKIWVKPELATVSLTELVTRLNT